MWADAVGEHLRVAVGDHTPFCVVVLPTPSRRDVRVLSIEDFKAVFDSSPDGLLIVDAAGLILAANPEIERQFGWAREELVGMGVETLIPRGARAAHRTHRASYANAPTVRPMGAGLDLRACRRDGSEFPVEVSLSPWRGGDDTMRVICAVRDVTPIKKLRSFSEAVMRATEEERARIARELHDDTAQRVAAMLLSVRRIVTASDDESRSRVVEELRGDIKETVEGIRLLSRGLRPPEIDELGLVQALEAHARALLESNGFRVHLDLEAVDDALTPPAVLALYRIIQEATTNVRRHAGVDEASLSLRREGGSVVAVVRDTGCGFGVDAPGFGTRGLGLIGMRERAAMFGGATTIESEPGAGSVVTVRLPVSDRASHG